jgi:hypothetical protein
VVELVHANLVERSRSNLGCACLVVVVVVEAWFSVVLAWMLPWGMQPQQEQKFRMELHCRRLLCCASLGLKDRMRAPRIHGQQGDGL